MTISRWFGWRSLVNDVCCGDSSQSRLGGDWSLMLSIAAVVSPASHESMLFIVVDRQEAQATEK